MSMAKLELKTPGELLDEITALRRALHEIDAIAVTKKAGALVRMQRVARKALSNGES